MWKNAISRNVEESFEEFLNPDLEDFQNLFISFLSTDTSLVEFQFLHEVANRQTDRQTDTQTDATENITTLHLQVVIKIQLMEMLVVTCSD